MNWTEIILALLTMLGGCGWFVSGRKHKHEIESLKADNRQKEMNRRTSERRAELARAIPSEKEETRSVT